MNDTLMALALAGAALSPFGWKLSQRWKQIRPVQTNQLQWEIAFEDMDDTLRVRYESHKEWLKTEWDTQFKNVGPSWLLRATPQQYERLVEKGWGRNIGKMPLTKYQAMDMLMLAQPAEPEDLELLDFFKIPLDSPNALLASYHANALRENTQAMQEWLGRTATVVQREALRYFKEKTPKALTAQEAQNTLNAIEQGLYLAGRSNEWEAWIQYKETWAALQCKETCTQYDLKKPTGAKIRDALLSLMKEKIPDWSEKDVVAQRLVELYPDLEMRKIAN